MAIITGVDINLRRVTICHLDTETGAVEIETRTVGPKVASLDCPQAMVTAITEDYPWHEHASAVWFERPSGQFIKSVADLSRVWGAVLATLPPWFLIAEIGPTAWKAAVGLPGNAKKPQIIEWAKARLNMELDEHMADAYAVALAGQLKTTIEEST